MKQDFFNNLPSEIIINVLSRLPARSVVYCKCVCKSWLHLLEGNEFARTHLSESLPALLIHNYIVSSRSYIVFYGEDGPYLLRQVNKTVKKLYLPDLGAVCSSSDGLLFLRDHEQIYICNPITRDCIKLHYPQELDGPPSWETYAFGKSKTNGQYKLVTISGDLDSKSECQVYTLGTGSWRTIAPGPVFMYLDWDPPAFFNGNLHWLVFSDGVVWVSCFNLETEIFTTFSTPILPDTEMILHVFTFGNYLCLHTSTLDNESLSDRMGTWLMKEYGVGNSWVKAEDESFIVGSLNNMYGFCATNPSSRRITKKLVKISRRYTIPHAVLYTPSFLSLKSFHREKLCSF